MQLCSLSFNGNQKRYGFVVVVKRKVSTLKIVRSVRNDIKDKFNDNGATEPTRVLLERLFTQTQKLEERINGDSHLSEDVLLGLNLENLESDLQAALISLKKKEEALQDAERMVLSEHSELDRAKEELEQREKDIAAACSKYEKLEEQLKQANLSLASQARQIEDLRLQLKERDKEIAAAKSALSFKKEEMDKMKNELVTRDEEAAKTNSELKYKAQLLTEANEVVKKQEFEIQGLQKAIREKEEELEVSVTVRKLKEEKLKATELNLEKQATEWLLAQEELKKLAGKASKNVEETNGTLEDFRRVKTLLADVRSELISSQQSLELSRIQIEEQDLLLQKQLEELEEQKKSVSAYMTSLKDAHIEVESERVKLRVVEARNKELERDLSMEKGVIEDLLEELKKEKSSLQLAIQETSCLQEELEKRNNEFGETRSLLHSKESELVEAKLEIQHLKFEHASLQLILEEKDLELVNARNKLEDLHQEVGELKMLMLSKEEQLIQATTMLKEKDEHVQTMQTELNDTKLRISEAESAVERIAVLTNELVLSTKDQSDNSLEQSNMILDSMELLDLKPTDNFRLQTKQLESELKFTREGLRMKEMEVLAAQRDLTIKDEELKTVLERLDAREKEVKRLKEEIINDANDLKKLYALAQERIGERSVGDLVTEKLQLETTQLEVEAATSALHKLAEMSRELLIKTSRSIEADFDVHSFPENGCDPSTSLADNNECFTEVKTEIARLSQLTQELVRHAGIALGDNS
ncbi:golgin subfamily A member 6-like protein 1 [Tripterygium wilfordii]|uniref:Golgin subfamily A member 6-like protein 1 n=1 Tax=Tripterygium wilfordii TaxID=458696 RepID=A0A7J7DP69_TRIWF|nr:golgin subfamily A member 6-like protein 1 [Tripterygium wilfordii]